MDTRLNPVAAGTALALTLGIMYAICTAIWIAWQTEAVGFLNDLFHGLDFRRIQKNDTSYSFAAFIVPLAVLAVWGFVTGTLYGFIHNALRKDRAPT